MPFKPAISCRMPADELGHHEGAERCLTQYEDAHADPAWVDGRKGTGQKRRAPIKHLLRQTNDAAHSCGPQHGAQRSGPDDWRLFLD